MLIWATDHFALPLPPEHRFPLGKYAGLRRALQTLDTDPSVPGFDLRVPPGATDDELAQAHCPRYVRAVAEGRLDRRQIRELGFPWSPALDERSRRSAGATLAASRQALRDGISVSLSGGTHHAFRDQPQGYCVFNDAAVAARVLCGEGAVRRLLIVDLDVHQGNGSASILAGDDRAFTFSMHADRNFPFQKVPSDLDIGLADGTQDRAYLDQLRSGLDEAFTRSDPELVIFLAGVDPWADDKLGRLALSAEGLRERDQLVIERCARARVPIAVTMAGGYAPSVDAIVQLHLQTVVVALNCAV